MMIDLSSIAVHAGFPELQLARPHGLIDFLSRQAELLPGGLVTQRGSLCDRFGSILCLQFLGLPYIVSATGR
jgi:hypothetical protein